MSDVHTGERRGHKAVTRSSGRKGLDGRVYPEHVEDELNQLAARVLGSPDGIRFTNYLRGITMNVAFLGDVAPQELMHMEGQRWLVGLMLSRVRAGNRPS